MPTSFEEAETSLEDAQPVELYRFTTSAGLDYRYTNSEEEVTDGNALVYTPAGVTRGQFNQSQEKTATEIELQLPYLDDITDDFAQLFIDQAPEGLTTLVIQKRHLTDTGNEFVQLWEGRVVSAAYDENGTLELLCKGMKNIFEREGPRAVWGSMCNHTLYDTMCGLTPGGFADFDATVDSIASDGVTLTLSGLSSPLRDFVGGQAIKDNGKDRRLIVKQAGNVITLQQPFRTDFVAGTTVDLETGCNHTTVDCINKFSNIANYGGFPYTPGLNPFNEGLDKI